MRYHRPAMFLGHSARRRPADGILADVFQSVGHEGQFVTVVPSYGAAAPALYMNSLAAWLER